MSSPKNQAKRARAAAGHRSSHTSGGGRRALVPIVGVVVVMVVAVAIALLASGGDDGSGDGDALATAGVTVRGEPLPELTGTEDPAVGMPAPTLEGVSPEGTPIDVDHEGDEPTLLAFLAHWCPHCQAELPNLVTLADEGALDDVRPVIVLTGTDSTAPNYPPAAWLEREGWEGTVILDDDDQPAAAAYGLTSYPYLVLVDADGNVLARSAGELGLEGLLTFVEQAA